MFSEHLNITTLPHISVTDKEAAQDRAYRWYWNNREKGLARAKKRYWKNKDNPEFKAKKLEQQHKSRLKNLDKTREGGLDYYYRNRQKYLDKHRDGILFLGKWVYLGFNPRRGICSQCGYEGFTAIHHIMYDSNNPAAYTIELCVKCHKTEPNGPILLA